MNVAIAILLLGLVDADSPEELARLHGAAVERWQTIDGVFELKWKEQGNPTTRTLRFQKSGDRFRCEERSTKTADVLNSLRGYGKSVMVSTGPTYPKPSVLIDKERDVFFFCSPPRHLLYGFLGFPEHSASLQEYLTQVHKSRSITRVREAGRDLVRIDLSVPIPAEPQRTWHFTDYLDPTVNYLVRKRINRVRGKDDRERRTETEVLEFRETAPGVLFPVRSKTVSYEQDKPVEEMTFKATELRVNGPIKDSVFELKIPPNAIVFDRIKGMTYETDANGRQIGTGKPIDPRKPIPKDRPKGA